MKTFPSMLSRLTRARIEPLNDCFFQFRPDNDGLIASILAVRGWEGDLVEIVAWQPEKPWHWWLLVGSLPLLGEDFIDMCLTRRDHVYLVGTPAEWWQQVEAGRLDIACVLDWSADPRFQLAGLHLVCTPAVAKRLREAHARCTRPTYSVSITVRDVE